MTIMLCLSSNNVTYDVKLTVLAVLKSQVTKLFNGQLESYHNHYYLTNAWVDLLLSKSIDQKLKSLLGSTMEVYFN